MRTILIVLDSVGIGEAPDAAKYGDAGSATLPHLAAAVGGVRLPTLRAMGLGNIPRLVEQPSVQGVPETATPSASFGAMREVSDGKDTITGHWEIAGLEMNPGFHVFPPDYPSFPEHLTREFCARTGRGVLGDKAASGTAIIEELGEEHMRTGDWICYTSADSVYQIAAHVDVIPLDELYRGCEVARELCNQFPIGRVIARPFRGEPGKFERTDDRRDFAFEPSEPTLLERLTSADVPVYAVGKIEDIYAHRGITETVHSGNMLAAQDEVVRLTREKGEGLIFANFIDFDMKYGHRRDSEGYARALEQTDEWLAEYLPLLGEKDVLILTADHGNDPTFEGTDHTREYVPLLVYRPGVPGKSLGVRQGFYDIAQSVLNWFGLPAGPRGISFLV